MNGLLCPGSMTRYCCGHVSLFALDHPGIFNFFHVKTRMIPMFKSEDILEALKGAKIINHTGIAMISG